MATRIGDGVSTFYSAYNNALNNKINAQKAYIDSYQQGINARNAINAEARTQDLYYTNTKPLNASNLSVVLPTNQILATTYNNPAYQKNMVDTSLASVESIAALARAGATPEQIAAVVKTADNNRAAALLTSKYGVGENQFAVDNQSKVQQQRADEINRLGEFANVQGKVNLTTAQQNLNILNGLNPDGSARTAPVGIPVTPTGIPATTAPPPQGGGTTPPPAPVDPVLANAAQKIKEIQAAGLAGTPYGQKAIAYWNKVYGDKIDKNIADNQKKAAEERRNLLFPAGSGLGAGGITPAKDFALRTRGGNL
jgi:hypothetical protein